MKKILKFNYRKDFSIILGLVYVFKIDKRFN